VCHDSIVPTAAERVKVKAPQTSAAEAKRPRPRRAPLELNRHELRALLCLIGRVRLTPIERVDLSGAVPELQRALSVAAAAAAPCHDTQNRVMTRGMAKKPPPPVVKRARGVPVQIYLSKSEQTDLKAIARKRELTIADVVRQWIRKARPKRKRAAGARPAPDPRQSELFNSGAKAAAHA
jgi:hypothetical protein